MPAEGKKPGPGTLTQARQRQAGQRAVDQDRTLAAMHQLEAALAAAAPRREQAWSNEVRRTLGILGQAARQEAENAAPDRTWTGTVTVVTRRAGITRHPAWAPDGRP